KVLGRVDAEDVIARPLWVLGHVNRKRLVVRERLKVVRGKVAGTASVYVNKRTRADDDVRFCVKDRPLWRLNVSLRAGEQGAGEDDTQHGEPPDIYSAVFSTIDIGGLRCVGSRWHACARRGSGVRRHRPSPRPRGSKSAARTSASSRTA